MKRFMSGPLFCTLFLALSLCGCQINLYSGLDEKEATAMMAMLMEQGISCDKIPAKLGWDLLVDKNDLPVSVRILARDGYPKNKYKTTGDLFGAKGLISSPQEDRIRYIYGLSQEIAQSISQMDGALSADVHLVLPENDPLSDSLKPSSASVFIKYHPNSSLRQNITQIKQLVLNAVQGRDAENERLGHQPVPRFPLAFSGIDRRNHHPLPGNRLRSELHAFQADHQKDGSQSKG
jgi:type III secretion protein J